MLAVVSGWESVCRARYISLGRCLFISIYYITPINIFLRDYDRIINQHYRDGAQPSRTLVAVATSEEESEIERGERRGRMGRGAQERVTADHLHQRLQQGQSVLQPQIATKLPQVHPHTNHPQSHVAQHQTTITRLTHPLHRY